MAVDFSLLPAEIPEPGKPPSRLVWTVVFLLLVLTGVFIVLLAWPKNLPTHTFPFWGTLALFPVGVPALIVLLRFQHDAARRVDIEMSNKATRQYNERVFAAASMPLAVLAASHRFSATPAENAISGIQSGALRLTMHELFARDSEPAKVRWIEVPGVKLRAGTDNDDRKRQIEVTRWLFGEMLEELADSINAVPVQAGLGVHLLISGMQTDAQNQALWQECWSSVKLRPAYMNATWHIAHASDLKTIDAWLDQLADGREQEAKLIVAVQLHPLLSASPPNGAAEAGAAVLLMPDTTEKPAAFSSAPKISRWYSCRPVITCPTTSCVAWSSTSAIDSFSLM